MIEKNKIYQMDNIKLKLYIYIPLFYSKILEVQIVGSDLDESATGFFFWSG